MGRGAPQKRSPLSIQYENFQVFSLVDIALSRSSRPECRSMITTWWGVSAMRRPSGSRPASTALPHEIDSRLVGEGELDGEGEGGLEGELDGEGDGDGGFRLATIQLARSFEAPRS